MFERTSRGDKQGIAPRNSSERGSRRAIVAPLLPFLIVTEVGHFVLGLQFALFRCLLWTGLCQRTGMHDQNRGPALRRGEIKSWWGAPTCATPETRHERMTHA